MKRQFLVLLYYSWILILLSFRPGLLGENHTPHLIIAFLFVSFFIVLFHTFRISFTTNKTTVLSFVIVVLMYFTIQGLLKSNSLQTVINSVLGQLIGVLSIYLVLRKENTSFIARAFVNIHFYLGVSIIITYLFFFAFGFNSIPHVAKLGIYGAMADGSLLTHHRVLYLPFTFIWSTVKLGFLTLPRAIGLYKKPFLVKNT